MLFAHSVYKSLYKPDNQIDVDEYRPDFASACEMNERYDAFVLPLANAFRPGFEDHLEQYRALIIRLKIPVVVVGVGAQAGLDLAELQGARMDRSVRAFVSAVLDRSATIGVRGEFTREYLNRLGFDSVDVIGCPSLAFYGADLRVQKLKDTLGPGDRMAVNHTGNLRTETTPFVHGVLRTCPHSTLVAQQETQIRQWVRIVSELPSDNSNEERIRYFTSLPPWLAFLKTQIFSFGTRIHGNIAALLAGVPAFLIAHDSRTLELARYHNIPHGLIGEIGEATQPMELYEKTDMTPFNAAIAAHFLKYKAFLERNGIEHGFADPRSAAAFDARLAMMTFPDRAVA